MRASALFGVLALIALAACGERERVVVVPQQQPVVVAPTQPAAPPTTVTVRPAN